MAKSACIILITNSANMEKLGQYRKTRPIVVLYWQSCSVLAEFNIFFLNWFKLSFCSFLWYFINWIWLKACWPILTISKLSCKIINDNYSMYLYFIYFYKLIKKNVINQVISYWPSYGSSVGYIGPRPRANTADLGHVILYQQKALETSFMLIYVVDRRNARAKKYSIKRRKTNKTKTLNNSKLVHQIYVHAYISWKYIILASIWY